MKVFAYVRVSTSTHDQTTDNQRKLIADAGFVVNEYVAEEGVSGSVKALERPAFKRMMDQATTGDTVIVTAIDRLGRNAIDILSVVEMFKELGIRLRVMQFDGIDLTSSTGKMLVTMMAAMAEMEKNMLIERTKAGLERARAEGRKFGRPLTITPAVLKELCKKKTEGKTLDQLAAEYDIPRNTIARNVRDWAEKEVEYEVEYIARQQQYNLKKAA